MTRKQRRHRKKLDIRRAGSVYPVFTGLVVVALARPEWLVEIDIIAVIPDYDGD